MGTVMAVFVVVFLMTMTPNLLASPALIPIPVANHSFEGVAPGELAYSCEAAESPDCYYSYLAPIPGWSTSADADWGQWISGGFNGNPGASDGTVMGWLDYGSIFQSVGTAAANSTYLLLIDFLHRTDMQFFGLAQLVIGDSVVATVTGDTPGAGQWSTWSATYSTTAADVGKEMKIVISSDGLQSHFDNVRLFDPPTNEIPTSVPEPTSISLLATGLLGLVGLGRRWKGSF